MDVRGGGERGWGREGQGVRVGVGGGGAGEERGAFISHM